MERHAMTVLFILLAGCLVKGELRPHPEYPSRLVDNITVNVLQDTDAVLNYTYPYSSIYSLTLFKENTIITSCHPGSLESGYPCNRTAGRFSLVDLPGNPYVVLTGVRPEDQGNYTVKVVKTREELLYLYFQLKVYRLDDLKMSITIEPYSRSHSNKLFDKSLTFADVNKSYHFDINLEEHYSYNITITPHTINTNISIIRTVDSKLLRLPLCSRLPSCHHLVRFEEEERHKDLHVRVEVEADVQNLPKMEFVFQALPLQKKGISAGGIAGVVITGIVFIIIFILAVIFRKRLCGQTNTEGSKHEKQQLIPLKAMTLEEMNQHVMPVCELQRAEYGFSIDVDFTLLPPSDTFGRIARKILVFMSGLMNTSGGVIVLTKKGGDSNNINIWQTRFESYIIGLKIISRDLFHSHVLIQALDDGLCLSVKRSQTHISVNYGMDPTENIYKEVRNILKDRLKMEAIRAGMVELDHLPRNSAILNNIRDQHLPMLDFLKSPDNKDQIVELIQRNLHTGGNILFRLEKEDFNDEGYLCPSEKIESEIKHIVEQNLEKICSALGEEHFHYGVDWHLKVSECRQLDVAERKSYILQLHITKPKWRVFKHVPESYRISGNSQLCQLSYLEWEYRMTRDHTTADLETSTALSTKSTSMNLGGGSKTNSLLRKNRPQDVLREHSDPAVSPFKPMSGSAISSILVRNPHNSGDDHKIKQTIPRKKTSWYKSDKTKAHLKSALHKQVLPWDQCSSYWKQEQMKLGKNNPSPSPHEVASAAFLMDYSSDLCFIPQKETIVQSRPALKRFIEEIGRVYKHNGKFAVVAEECESQSEEIVCSVLVVTKQGTMCLHTLYRAEDKSCEDLSLQLARELKRKLVDSIFEKSFADGDCYRDMLSFVIKTENRFIESNEERVTSNEEHVQIDVTLQKLIDENLRLQNNNHCNTLHKEVKRLGISSLQKVKQSDGFQAEYTMDNTQMEGLIQSSTKMFNFIEGPPGSGKTLMAIATYKNEQKYHPAGSVLYACSTKPLAAFLNHNGVENTVVVDHSNAFSQLIGDDDPSWKVLIMDDSQNVVDGGDEKPWMNLYRMLVKHKKKFYVFADSKYQDFKRTGEECLPQKCFHRVFKDNYSMTCLAKVYRNCKKVVGYMKASIDTENMIECANGVDGDNVLYCTVMSLKDKTTRNGVLRFIQMLLGNKHTGFDYKLNRKYKPGDIVLLIDSKDSESDVLFYIELFSKHLPVIRVKRAQDVSVDGLTVETLDNFVGLESQVCVFLGNGPHDRNRTLDNNRYKVFVASRGVNLVSFLQEEDLSLNDAEKMKFDDLEDIFLAKYATFGRLRDANDIPATLEIIRHREDANVTDKGLIEALSCIASLCYEENSAKAFVNNGGVDLFVGMIEETSENEELRERALITLSEVSLHDSLRHSLLTENVINVARSSLESSWDPESWEAAYLLSHLLHNFKTTWSLSVSIETIVEELNDAIPRWKDRDVTAVAHQMMDYKAYAKLLQDFELPVVQYLAAWSLANLVLTKSEDCIPDVKKYVTLEMLEDINLDPRVSDVVKELLGQVLDVCKVLKIAPSAWHRDYDSKMRPASSMENSYEDSYGDSEFLGSPSLMDNDFKFQDN